MFTESSQICFIKYSRVSATSHTSTNIKSRIKYNKNRLTKEATQHTASNNITIASKTLYSYIKTRLSYESLYHNETSRRPQQNIAHVRTSPKK